ncbi:hypothetical protein [Catellatospora tritici]|uniref:hypothetical protein n=1 Tax=Catellatospora tritici TaxID=2851566 RepID=UPI001C2CE7A3|nr:hypothetical protein [Catellatospora tritici]MBV1854596.1 hypothetical protein [Catellatospora tritici]
MTSTEFAELIRPVTDLLAPRLERAGFGRFAVGQNYLWHRNSVGDFLVVTLQHSWTMPDERTAFYVSLQVVPLPWLCLVRETSRTAGRELVPDANDGMIDVRTYSPHGPWPWEYEFSAGPDDIADEIVISLSTDRMTAARRFLSRAALLDALDRDEKISGLRPVARVAELVLRLDESPSAELDSLNSLIADGDDGASDLRTWCTTYRDRDTEIPTMPRADEGA